MFNDTMSHVQEGLPLILYSNLQMSTERFIFGNLPANSVQPFVCSLQTAVGK